MQFVSLRECEVRWGSVSLFTKLQSPRWKLTFCRSEYLFCIEEGAEVGGGDNIVSRHHHYNPATTITHLGRGKLDPRRPCWLLRRLWEKDRQTGPGYTPRDREPAPSLLCRLATCSDRTKICTSPEIVKTILVSDPLLIVITEVTPPTQPPPLVPSKDRSDKTRDILSCWLGSTALPSDWQALCWVHCEWDVW